MPHPRLIPCLDVANGRVTKCVRFEDRRDVGDPVALALAYAEGGADELVLLDIEATLEGRRAMRAVVAEVAGALDVPFTAGGGIRSVEDAAALVDAGADRVSVNTAALHDEGIVEALAARYGSQAVVVAMDVRGGIVHSHAGTKPTRWGAVAWARRAEALGAGELLVTSIDADGTRDGYDLGLTAAVAGAVTLPVIASGGAGCAAHVAAAFDVVPAALVASIAHDDPSAFGALRHELVALGVELRSIDTASARA